MAQSVKHLALAQVMISGFLSSSPDSGSVLTPQSLEPASDSVSPSFSALPQLPLCLCLCLSLSFRNKLKKKKHTKKQVFVLSLFQRLDIQSRGIGRATLPPECLGHDPSLPCPSFWPLPAICGSHWFTATSLQPLPHHTDIFSMCLHVASLSSRGLWL